MTSNGNIKMKCVGSLLTLVLLIQVPKTYAWGGGGGRGGGPGPGGHFDPPGRCFDTLPLAALMLIMAGATYYYLEGVYYQRQAGRYIVVPAPVGAVVTTIPTGYPPVIIDGVVYYTINGVTYMPTPSGYQVVPQPRTIVIQNNNTVSVAPAVASAQNASSAQGSSTTNAEESFTVNIPNSKGNYTPVVLKRSGNGFIGPQGEYYPEFPRIEQLKVMYAK